MLVDGLAPRRSERRGLRTNVLSVISTLPFPF